MNSDWERVKLGCVLQLDLDKVSVGDGEYPAVGVLNRGRGLFAREPVTSSTTSYKVLTRVRAGQVIYSKLKAFEGSITVVPPEHDGKHVSSEFPTFTCNSRLLPGYMELVARRPELWEELALFSKGIGGRRERLSPQDFLELFIELPPVDEQQRIVDLMGSMDNAIEAADTSSHCLSLVAQNIRHTHFADPAPSVAVGDVYEVTAGKQLQSKAQSGIELPYLRAGNIADGYLDLQVMKTMYFTDVEAEKLALRQGDVLIVEGGNGYGKSAVWDAEIHSRVAYQNHVIRIRAHDEATYPSVYVAQWARWCHEQGQFRYTGSGIPNLGVSKVRAMRIPELSTKASVPAAIMSASAADEAVCEANIVADSLRALRSEMLSALLSGAHRIPETYDELMGA